MSYGVLFQRCARTVVRQRARCQVSLLRAAIPPGARILWIGCPALSLLAALGPAKGVAVGVQVALDVATDTITAFTHIDTLGVAERFDYIITAPDLLVQTAHPLTSIVQLQQFSTERTRLLCLRHTRIGAWLMGAESLPRETYRALFAAAGYEVITTARGGACAFTSSLMQGIVAALPGLRVSALYELFTLAPRILRFCGAVTPRPSVSIIMPCRNERGSIAQAIARMPQLGDETELICVEGHSTDGTLEELYRVRDAGTALPMQVMVQTGIGKQNAVAEACAAATGDILIIFDGDMTLAPEDLVHFYEALASGRADCANGTRFLLPMEAGAMRWQNWYANRAIAVLLSWPLGQRVSDTLCGTKAVWRIDYERSRVHSARIWELDPFGDFAFLLSTVAASGKILDIPISYRDRIYGAPLQGCFRYGLRLWRLGIYACWVRFCRGAS